MSWLPLLIQVGVTGRYRMARSPPMADLTALPAPARRFGLGLSRSARRLTCSGPLNAASRMTTRGDHTKRRSAPASGSGKSFAVRGSAPCPLPTAGSRRRLPRRSPERDDAVDSSRQADRRPLPGRAPPVSAAWRQARLRVGRPCASVRPAGRSGPRCRRPSARPPPLALTVRGQGPRRACWTAQPRWAPHGAR